MRPYGEAFEALRDEPAESKVFLATMGTIAAHTARATFAANLFAAGGIDVVNEGRHDDVEAVLGHYDEQPVVCLVGHDKAYAEWGADLVTGLRDAGARWVDPRPASPSRASRPTTPARWESTRSTS